MLELEIGGTQSPENSNCLISQYLAITRVIDENPHGFGKITIYQTSQFFENGRIDGYVTLMSSQCNIPKNIIY